MRSKIMFCYCVVCVLLSCSSKRGLENKVETNEKIVNDDSLSKKYRAIGESDNGLKAGAWKYYTGEKLVKVVHYYKGEAIVELDPMDFDFEKVDFSINGDKYSISIPTQWEKKVINSENTIFYAKKTRDTTLNYFPNLILRFEMSDSPLLDYVNGSINLLLETKDSKLGFKECNDSIQYPYCNLGTVIREDDLIIGGYTRIVKYGKYYIIISASANADPSVEFMKYKELFAEVCSSLKPI